MVYIVKNILDYTNDEYYKMYLNMPEIIKKRVNDKKLDINQKQTLIGYHLLKYLLSEYYGLKMIPPIEFDEFGKPFFSNVDLHFNISHSYNLVACALSENNIGLDIQKIVDKNEKLYSYVCNKKELRKITSSDDPKAEFIILWTKKESYLKCLGSGINVDLKDVLQDSNINSFFTTTIEATNDEKYILTIYEE